MGSVAASAMRTRTIAMHPVSSNDPVLCTADGGQCPSGFTCNAWEEGSDQAAGTECNANPICHDQPTSKECGPDAPKVCWGECVPVKKDVGPCIPGEELQQWGRKMCEGHCGATGKCGMNSYEALSGEDACPRGEFAGARVECYDGKEYTFSQDGHREYEGGGQEGGSNGDFEDVQGGEKEQEEGNESDDRCAIYYDNLCAGLSDDALRQCLLQYDAEDCYEGRVYEGGGGEGYGEFTACKEEVFAPCEEAVRRGMSFEACIAERDPEGACIGGEGGGDWLPQCLSKAEEECSVRAEAAQLSLDCQEVAQKMCAGEGFSMEHVPTPEVSFEDAGGNFSMAAPQILGQLAGGIVELSLREGVPAEVRTILSAAATKVAGFIVNPEAFTPAHVQELWSMLGPVLAAAGIGPGPGGPGMMSDHPPGGEEMMMWSGGPSAEEVQEHMGPMMEYMGEMVGKIGQAVEFIEEEGAEPEAIQELEERVETIERTWEEAQALYEAGDERLMEFLPRLGEDMESMGHLAEELIDQKLLNKVDEEFGFDEEPPMMGPPGMMEGQYGPGMYPGQDGRMGPGMGMYGPDPMAMRKCVEEHLLKQDFQGFEDCKAKLKGESPWQGGEGHMQGEFPGEGWGPPSFREGEGGNWEMPQGEHPGGMQGGMMGGRMDEMRGMVEDCVVSGGTKEDCMRKAREQMRGSMGEGMQGGMMGGEGGYGGQGPEGFRQGGREYPSFPKEGGPEGGMGTERPWMRYGDGQGSGDSWNRSYPGSSGGMPGGDMWRSGDQHMGPYPGMPGYSGGTGEWHPPMEGGGNYYPGSTGGYQPSGGYNNYQPSGSYSPGGTSGDQYQNYQYQPYQPPAGSYEGGGTMQPYPEGGTTTTEPPPQ